jgi:hypothetical protein
MMMTVRKHLPTPAAITLATTPFLLLMTGCTTAKAPTSPSSGSATAAPTASAPTGTPQPPGASDNGAAAGSRCHTGDLRVTRQPAPGGGAAGNLYDWLVFTNTSTRTCTLYGFPGVSYLTGPTGQQVNDPARRSGDNPGRVTLDPQQAGHATVHTGQPGNFPDTCKPVAVAGYRVYPPDETAAVFVAAPSQQCSANGVDVAEISPIQPGTT